MNYPNMYIKCNENKFGNWTTAVTWVHRRYGYCNRCELGTGRSVGKIW